jgi:flagellar hook-associated protein 2
VMGNPYGPGVATNDLSSTTTLGAVGLVRAKDGSLSLDDAKLSAALAANPDAVGNLFVTGGFATAMTGLTDSYTRAGDGLLASKTRSLGDRFTALQTQVDRINSHADSLKIQLEKQFTALETAMSQLKSQSSYLSSILG